MVIVVLVEVTVVVGPTVVGVTDDGHSQVFVPSVATPVLVHEFAQLPVSQERVLPLQLSVHGGGFGVGDALASALGSAEGSELGVVDGTTVGVGVGVGVWVAEGDGEAEGEGDGTASASAVKLQLTIKLNVAAETTENLIGLQNKFNTEQKLNANY